MCVHTCMCIKKSNFVQKRMAKILQVLLPVVAHLNSFSSGDTVRANVTVTSRFLEVLENFVLIL